MRLHRALRETGIDSHLLVQEKSCDDDYVFGAKTTLEEWLNKFRPSLDTIPLRLYRKRKKLLFSTSWIPSNTQLNKIRKIDPDIVHLHWINGGFLNIEDLKKINKPIVWTLHDNWAFTGGCHIMWDCEKYKQSCGSCHILESVRERDLSRLVWKRKEKAYSKINNLTIVGLSKWITNCAEESSLFSGKRMLTIPNAIDTDEFKPMERWTARERLKLSQSKQVILFGAHNAVTDLNKGFGEFYNSVNGLDRNNIEIVVFGNKEQNNPNLFKFKTHYMGIIENDESLVELYNAADVMVVPSKQEAFGQTAIEAMACGIPVVGFGKTGLLDIVDHKVNGYLAEPFDIKDLTTGIDWILGHSNKMDLSGKARGKIISSFSKEIVVEKYLSLYSEIIEGK